MLWIHIGVDGSIDCQVNVGNRIRQGNAFQCFMVTSGTSGVENFEVNKVGYLKPTAQEVVTQNVAVSVASRTFELERPSQVNSFFKNGVEYKGYLASIPSDATSFYANGGHISLVIYMVTKDDKIENSQNVSIFVEPTKGNSYVGISQEDYYLLDSLIASLEKEVDNIHPENFVRKIDGDGTNYKVYMAAPNGDTTTRIISSSVVNGGAVLRNANGQIVLPNPTTSIPVGDQAISRTFADGTYIPSDITNQNSIPLKNGATEELRDGLKSTGNVVSKVIAFQGENVTNVAKGLNSMALGRLNEVNGAGSFAYGNKNIVKGIACATFGGGNSVGDVMDWTTNTTIENSSTYCFAIGENNTSVGRDSIALGVRNQVYGDGSLALGSINTVYANNNIAIGRNSTLHKYSYEGEEPQGEGVVAIGTGLMTPNRRKDPKSNELYWDCVVLGRYNDPNAYSVARDTDAPYMYEFPAVFTLGAGNSDDQRANAIVVLHDGAPSEPYPHDWIYFNSYGIFNRNCEFRGSNNKVTMEGNLQVNGNITDKNGDSIGTAEGISNDFINGLFVGD